MPSVARVRAVLPTLRLLTCAAVALATACAGDDPPIERADSVGAQAGAAAGGAARADSTAQAKATPAAVTREQFASLRWLEGRWRGVDRNGGMAPFFEQYTVASDSVIRSQTFSDSTFTTVSDSSSIRFVDGRVESGTSATSWVVNAWDGNRVAFAPMRGATNSFIWEQVSDDRWTATLAFRNGSQRVYEMSRVR